MQAIRCENVSIRYITGDFKDIGLKEYVMRRLKNQYEVREFWADRGVSFSLEKGDMLGIIGVNGAGKSTLLKAVSGIMAPTEGSMEVNGSVAALLELGSGFDPDLTVRENTFLRGAMLGYTRSFMEEKYDEIIAFAELEDFQDRRFKQLSSGMKSRLAFSIACLVHPDILILDEVLSVGDGAFRKKSGDKMKEILSSGVTGILVSHSVSQVREMCNKILWVDHGKQILFTDDVEAACDAYEEFLDTHEMPESVGRIRSIASPAPVKKTEDKQSDKAAVSTALGTLSAPYMPFKDAISIPFRGIVAAAYLYMVVPIEMFFLFWLKGYIGIPAAILFGAGLCLLLKKDYGDGRRFIVSPKALVVGAIALAVYLWLTGQGGFFFQYSDNHYRNAIFADLVNFDWPVVYEQTGNALDYYFLHWLPPAFIGKLLGNFMQSRAVLYCWTLLGVWITILLVAAVLNLGTGKKLALVVCVFMMWSGVNIIGGVISSSLGLIDFALNTFRWWTLFTIDGQNYSFMFRSNCGQLCSVYNQTIAPWLAITLLADRPRPSTFVFLAACTFAYAPIPFLGLAAFMIFYFIRGLFTRRDDKAQACAYFLSAFSPANLLAFITVVPIFLLFFAGNTAAMSGANGSMFSLYIAPEKFNIWSLVILVCFYVLQFGLFAFFIRKEYNRDPVYWFMLVSMCVIPLVKFGTMGDFCWNACVPAYFLLMIYTIRYLNKNIAPDSIPGVVRIKKSIICLTVCLALAALDPFTIFLFGFKVVHRDHNMNIWLSGQVDTFADKQIEDKLYLNFLVKEDETAFFKYLAK